MIVRADFSRASLEKGAFTGVAPEGQASQDAKVLSAGHVDFMKTDFIDLESSSIVAKQGAAAVKQEEAAPAASKSVPAW